MKRRSFLKGLLFAIPALPAIVDSMSRGLLVDGKVVVSHCGDIAKTAVVKMYHDVQKAVKAACNQFIFEPNDKVTREALKSQVDQYLVSMRERDVIHGFHVVCDSTNNSPEDIKNHRMNVDVYYQMKRVPEYRVVRATSVKNPENFSDLA